MIRIKMCMLCKKTTIIAFMLLLILSPITPVVVTADTNTPLHVQFLYDKPNQLEDGFYRYISINNETIILRCLTNTTRVWHDYNNNTVNVTGIYYTTLHGWKHPPYTPTLHGVLNNTELAKFNSAGNETHIILLSNYTGPYFHEQIFITVNSITSMESFRNPIINYTLQDVEATNASDILNPSRALYTVMKYLESKNVSSDSVPISELIYIPGSFINKTMLGDHDFVWYIYLSNFTENSSLYTPVANYWFFVSPEAKILLAARYIGNGLAVDDSAVVTLLSINNQERPYTFLLSVLGVVALTVIGTSVIVYKRKLQRVS